MLRVVQSTPFIESIVASSTGVSYPAINSTSLGHLSIPVPDRDTQTAIADFLDRESIHIDQLIEKTQRSIECLCEFRSALITAAVTGRIDVANWDKRGQTDRRLDEIEEGVQV